MRSHKQGFTLIELLVVIAIIGLLSSVIFASLGTARAKSRDARRVQDLRNIQKALELYYTHNGKYPSTGGTGSWRTQCANFGGYAQDLVVYDPTLTSGIVPQFMSVLPADPSMNAAASSHCYMYTSNGTDFKLVDFNIPTANVASQPVFVDPRRNLGAAWDVSTDCSSKTATYSWGVWSSANSRCW
jgi:general secretion pathway protein G